MYTAPQKFIFLNRNQLSNQKPNNPFTCNEQRFAFYVPFTYQICYNIVIWDIQERKYFYKPPFPTDTKAVMKSNPNLHLMLFVAGNERILLQYFESSFQLSPRSVYIFLSLFRVLKTLLLHKVILYVKEC